MFVIVVEIRAPADATERVRGQHVDYSELASRHPGIRYKHVMQGTLDPTFYVDVMVWDTKEQSEAFGIDPTYQKRRPAWNPTNRPVGELSPINPGYYSPVIGFVSERPSANRQNVIYVQASPGKERQLERLVREERDAASLDPRVRAFHLYRNNGWPSRYVLAIQATDRWSEEQIVDRLKSICAQPPLADHGDLIVRYDFKEMATVE